MCTAPFQSDGVYRLSSVQPRRLKVYGFLRTWQERKWLSSFPTDCLQKLTRLEHGPRWTYRFSERVFDHFQ
jgi:hypothetical protein